MFYLALWFEIKNLRKLPSTPLHVLSSAGIIRQSRPAANLPSSCLEFRKRPPSSPFHYFILQKFIYNAFCLQIGLWMN